MNDHNDFPGFGQTLWDKYHKIKVGFTDPRLSESNSKSMMSFSDLHGSADAGFQTSQTKFVHRRWDQYMVLLADETLLTRLQQDKSNPSAKWNCHFFIARYKLTTSEVFETPQYGGSKQIKTITTDAWYDNKAFAEKNLQNRAHLTETITIDVKPIADTIEEYNKLLTYEYFGSTNPMHNRQYVFRYYVVGRQIFFDEDDAETYKVQYYQDKVEVRYRDFGSACYFYNAE
jgi:hypothetical protein